MEDDYEVSDNEYIIDFWKGEDCLDAEDEKASSSLFFAINIEFVVP